MTGFEKEYAKALFDILLEKNKIGSILHEFVVIASTIDNDNDFIRLLEHPKITKDEKKSVVDQVFGRIDKTLKHFLYVLIDNHRLQNIYAIYLAYCDLYNEFNQVLEVKAYTAIPLDTSRIEQLETQLSKKYNQKVIVANEMDTSIIGGIRLVVNNEVFDHTISNHLSNLKNYVLKQN